MNKIDKARPLTFVYFYDSLKQMWEDDLSEDEQNQYRRQQESKKKDVGGR